MGTDARVVDAARVSFSKLAEQYTEEQNGKLISYLARHNHFTPFTHPQVTIHEKVPIFVARQRLKHTVGFTYNEVSRRYVDDTPEFHVPKEWRERPSGSMKQGSGSGVVDELLLPDHIVWDDPTSPQITTSIHTWYRAYLDFAQNTYELMIESDVAPEQARMVLPQAAFTEYYVTGSLAAWARAYKLRSDSHAQKEIQDLAVQWDDILRPLFPVSWSALVDPVV